MFWRTNKAPPVFRLCLPINLPKGILISHNFDEPVRYITSAVYKQKCILGLTPMLNTNVHLVMNRFSEPLPIVKELWLQFTLGKDHGAFIYSVVPIIYLISILAVVTWFLTIFVYTYYTMKPLALLRLLTLLSLVFMLVVVVKSIVILHNQQLQGYLCGEVLIDKINYTKWLNVIDMVATFLLQINQVQAVMRLFLRQKDKRLIFLTGIAASISAQTLWGVTRFHNFKDSEAGKIIPAFAYLVRIAMGMCYAAIFTAFLLTKVKIIYVNRLVWLISALTLVFINAPVAFFIADVSSTWAYELSEVFSVATYVVGVVIPWEWCNQYNHIRRAMEKEGVLGRHFHEDELYELDRMDLFVEDESDGLKPEPVKPRLLAGIAFAMDKFVDLTDKIIATGLAIPRAGSTSSGPASEEPPQPRAGHGHHVFVYTTKDVHIDWDEDRDQY